jgi:hypothetical protein
MKPHIHKLIGFCLTLIFMLSSPHYLIAQNKLVGELVITKTSPEGFVTVNNERAVSGRSITSTSEIVTSSQASAKVLLPQTGTILVSPNSRLILSFINLSISGDLSYGEVTIETLPNTSLNFLVPDGAIATTNQNQANIIKATVENKKTRIQTLTGAVSFNNVLVSAGEFYPVATNDKATSDKSVNVNSKSSKSFNPLLIIAVLGAVAAVALIAASSNNSESSNVSPTR